MARQKTKSPRWTRNHDVLLEWLSDDDDEEYVVWDVPLTSPDMSDSEPSYDDIIEIYKYALIDVVSPYTLIPTIVNLMFNIERLNPSKLRIHKIALICDILNSFPQLNDTKYLHRSLVTKLYNLSDTDNLLYIRQKHRNRSCCC